MSTTFDPNTYEPQWPSEFHQRMHQARSEASVILDRIIPAVLDPSPIEGVLETLGTYGRLSDLDVNPLAQNVAVEMMQSAAYPSSSDGGHPRVDLRWADESAPYRALIRDAAADTLVWVPLLDPQRWEEVAKAYLDPRSICDAHHHPACKFYAGEPSWPDLQAYPIKRGEHIVIAFMCSICRERCNNWDRYADGYIGTGPMQRMLEPPDRENDPFCDYS